MPRENETVSCHSRTAQVKKTEEDITEALLQLLATTPLKDLTVADVVEKAGYARRTFYRHYDNLQDVLVNYLGQLTRQLFEILGEGEVTFPKMFQRFFAFWEKHYSLLTVLKKNHLFYLLQQSWVDNLEYSRLTKDDLKNSGFGHAFALGGMFAVLETWVNTGGKFDSVTMAQVAKQIQAHLLHEK